MNANNLRTPAPGIPVPAGTNIVFCTGAVDCIPLNDSDRRWVVCDERTQPGQFQVWIDTNCGMEPKPDWWWNSEPKPFMAAMQEAVECWRTEWVAMVLPAGVNPRPDGRWDNPASSNDPVE